jgi:hypothetical protein
MSQSSSGSTQTSYALVDGDPTKSRDSTLAIADLTRANSSGVNATVEAGRLGEECRGQGGGPICAERGERNVPTGGGERSKKEPHVPAKAGR